MRRREGSAREMERRVVSCILGVVGVDVGGFGEGGWVWVGLGGRVREWCLIEGGSLAGLGANAVRESAWDRRGAELL